MSLQFSDSTKTPLVTNLIRSFHDGHLGSSYEQLVYLRNGDVSKYYTNITVSLVVSSYEDLGELGTTGWGTKFFYGERRPTEAEWDLLRPGETIDIPDIGSASAADTFTYHPIWIRVTCPGGTGAGIRENTTLRVQYFERNVGE